MRLRLLSVVLGAALCTLGFQTFCVQSLSALQAPQEDDWSLPSWVTTSPNSGLYGGFNLPAGVTKVDMKTFTWKDLNPSENVYNWAPLDSAVAGPPFLLRLYNSDTLHVPGWLTTKYPDLTPLQWRWGGLPYNDNLGHSSSGLFYPMWHRGFEAEFHKLLMAFKARNYAANPKFVGWYIPGGWPWNEWTLKWTPEMTRAGISPSTFLAWFNRLKDDYIAASNGNPGKLVYTGTDGPEWVEYTGDSTSYNTWVSAINLSNGSNAMSTAMTQAGTGTRYGATEWFNYVTHAPNWGMTRTLINGANYMVTNDAHPFLTSVRFFGTENECFATCGVSPAGADNYYHVKMATLKALQLRMNWVFISNWNLGPTIFPYMIRTLGKRVSDSPDAWVALREAEDRENGTTGPVVRNWERWLVQRETSPDGFSVKTAAITSPDARIGTSYEARRTNHAGGSDYLYFGVNDGFITGGPIDVQVNVTYLDNNAVKWRIDYDQAGGDAYAPSDPVQNINDGLWKTAKILISGAGFSNRQNGGSDFRIFNGGINDLTVRFVRVIKMNAPTIIAAPTNVIVK
jgi:hypothetical protein